jgi:hypothetical protein
MWGKGGMLQARASKAHMMLGSVDGLTEAIMWSQQEECCKHVHPTLTSGWDIIRGLMEAPVGEWEECCKHVHLKLT